MSATLMVWSARTLSPLVRMGVVVLISRVLGAEGLGEYQVLLAYLAVFEMIPALGLWPLVVRNVARQPAEAFRYLLHACVLSLAASLLLVIPMSLTGFGYAATVREGMVVLSLSLLPSVLVVVCEAVLIGTGTPQAVALLRLGENVLLVGASALLLRAGEGILALVWAIVGLRTLTAAGALALALRGSTARRWRFEWSFARTLLAEAPVFFVSSVVWALYSRLDIMALSRLVSLEEVGYYGAAQRILVMCQEIPQSVLLIVFPLLAAAYARDPAEFDRLMARTAKYFAIFALPVAVGATLLGRDLLRLVFGAPFAGAAPVLACLMWSFLPFGLMKLLGSGLIATNHQAADLAINLAVLVVTLVLLLVLVPAAGALGAAAAVLASVSVAVVLRLAYFARRVRRLGLEPRTVRALGATGVMAVALVAARGLPLPATVAIGAATYLVGLVVLGTFDRAEIESVPVIGGMLSRQSLVGFLDRSWSGVRDRW